MPTNSLRIHSRDRTLEEVQRHLNLFARIRLSQHSQDLGKQTVPFVQSISGVPPQVGYALETRKQHRISQCLGVRVRELEIIRVTEEEPTPFLSQYRHCRSRDG
ncbi:hypothetical protein SAMN05421870_118115 [Streptomyces qinglanensis]|uniref:Uncharacterized protein n=1 Tax=Streptomyces qinglanensis TaxID=943816 RepID=A0A1H9WKP5_9ACTN|nr:hypothetical protein SAMN05421870_118115 [Streptomyces qinglanensis]